MLAGSDPVSPSPQDRDARSARSRALEDLPVRPIFAALLVALTGAVGACPGSASRPDAWALATWLAIGALPAGCWLAASTRRVGPLVLVPPIAWTVVLAWVDATSPRGLPQSHWAALACAGLFLAGFGLARAFERSAIPIACAAFACSSLLAASPFLPRLVAPLPSPAARARAIALSPVTLVLECAGVDLLRHPVLYSAAETADLDPSVYTPWRGKLAAPAVFLLGCAAAAAGGWLARQRARGR